MVFIVGFFRTGSTLLEKLLCRHPAIFGLGEDSPLNLGLKNLEQDMLLIARESERVRKHKKDPNNEKYQKKIQTRFASTIEAINYHAEQIVMKMKVRALGSFAYSTSQPPRDIAYMVAPTKYFRFEQESQEVGYSDYVLGNDSYIIGQLHSRPCLLLILIIPCEL